jgi:hypothetical protein
MYLTSLGFSGIILSSTLYLKLGFVGDHLNILSSGCSFTGMFLKWEVG